MSARMYRMQSWADVLLNNWKQLARRRLQTSSATVSEYISKLTIDEVSESKLVISLRGTFANMFEQGMGSGGVGSYGPYDMKTFTLKPGTKNLRFLKDGRMYVNIPFEHSPGSIESRGGSAALGMAKRLDAARTMLGPIRPGGRPPGTVWGGKKGRLPSGLSPRIRTTATSVVDPLTGRTLHSAPHATDPLAGMVRFQKTYAKKTENKFMTWRRMIEGQQKWIHPGIRPRRIADNLNVDRFIAAMW